MIHPGLKAHFSIFVNSITLQEEVSTMNDGDDAQPKKV